MDDKDLDKFIGDLNLKVSKEYMGVFYALGMKNGIRSVIVNDENGDVFHLSFLKENIVDSNEVENGGVFVPKVQTEKNKILTRAMTWISEDAQEMKSAKEIVEQLASLMDKEDPKEIGHKCQSCYTRLPKGETIYLDYDIMVCKKCLDKRNETRKHKQF